MKTCLWSALEESPLAQANTYWYGDIKVQKCGNDDYFLTLAHGELSKRGSWKDTIKNLEDLNVSANRTMWEDIKE